MASKGNDWITVKRKRKRKDEPSEIRIDKDGNVFIDGELYDDNNTQYKKLSISVEKYNKSNTGEETQKMINQHKKAMKGKKVVISDVKEPNKNESTVVKF